MRKLTQVFACIALVLAAATGPPAHGYSSNWATSDALGSVVVSFDGRVTVYDGATLGVIDGKDVAGANDDVAFDNALNLSVANGSQVAAFGEASPHDPSVPLAIGSPVRALAFAGDGTLYVGTTNGTIGRIWRYLPGGTEPDATFTIPVDSADCMGMDLGADQTTLYVVSGGGTVLQVDNAGGGELAPNPHPFKSLQAGGNRRACGIRLLPPERGSAVGLRNHGGMLIAFGQEILRLSKTGVDAETVIFNRPGSPSQQKWVDVAVDPRLVYEANGAATDVHYIFWGIDAQGNLIARFQTNLGPNPLDDQSTDDANGLTSDIPRGLALNGELRVAQVVRHLTLPADTEMKVTFLAGTAYQHKWKATTDGAADVAVMAFEVTSDGAASANPNVFGRCDPSLDVDCRFVTNFIQLPTAVAYSRNRAVAYRLIRFSDLTSEVNIAAGVEYTDAQQSSGAASCSPGNPAGAAVSLLRDPFLPTGHDQFAIDNTISFFDFDDGVNESPVPLETDYVVVHRKDVPYTSIMNNPDPRSPTPTTVQFGSSLPISFAALDANCSPVGSPGINSSDIVLTVTELAGNPTLAPLTKGDPVADSNGVSSLGLAPWIYNGGQWRTNVDIMAPVFEASTPTAEKFYVLCVIAKASANARKFGDMCAAIKVVKGGGKK